MRTLVFAISRIFGYLSGLLLVLITLGIVANIISRALFGTSIVWMLEAVEYALIAVTFLGAAWVLTEDKHTRVDILITSVRPSIAAMLTLIANVVGFATMCIMTWFATAAAIGSKASHAFIYKYLEFPEWWIYAGIPFATGLLALVFLFRILERFEPQNSET